MAGPSGYRPCEPRFLYVGRPGFLRRPTGAGLRCRMFLGALGQAGSVEVFEPPSEPRLLRKAQAAGNRMRRAIPGTRASRSARSAFRERLRDPFDLVWFSDLYTFISFGSAVHGRVAVDIARVESLNLGRELDSLDPGGWEARRVERQRELWRQLERRHVPRADLVSLCNDVDRGALASADAVIVPTGYEEPRAGRDDIALHDPPVLILQGTLHLAQNVDAARYVIDEILPKVRRAFPTAQLRIVGPGPEDLLARLNRIRGVVATGYVDDMADELTKADVALAPLRHGGGIHVKVIEAFAHRVPVVATPIATEGIDPVPGEEALVAEGADELAGRCVELLQDDDLRHRIATSGRELFRRRFELAAVQARLADIALGVAGHSGEPIGSSPP